MSVAVRKAVFPVAGLGTRFLPATKANPKEMLPVVDKPLIQYAAEEAVAAGITDLIFVTGRNKRAIPDHFDKAYELEMELEKAGKRQMLEIVRGILPEGVTCSYIRQPEALGLGHAVLCAASVVGDAPFAVLLADDLIAPPAQGPSCLSQMVRLFEQTQCSVLGVEEIAPEHSRRYGVVDPGERTSERAVQVAGLVEKPEPADAPSNLGIVGRYILTPEIFPILENTGRGAGGEIQLTDAIAELIPSQGVCAYSFLGKRYDCGDKLGYLEATVEFALGHPQLGEQFARYLTSIRP